MRCLFFLAFQGLDLIRPICYHIVVRNTKKKRCPRCNRKMDILAPKCDTCGLIFDRLKFATNSAGKKALKQGLDNKVVYVKTPPSDVSKWKLFFIALFFGFTGVQYKVVGRMKWFYFMFISFIITITFGTIEFFGIYLEGINIYLSIIMYFIYLPGAISTLMWFASAFQIAFNFFKYPVSIDESYSIEQIDAKAATEILQEVYIQREKEKIENLKPARERIVCASCGKRVRISKDDIICPRCGGSLYDEVKNE